MKINLHCQSFWSFIKKIHKNLTFHWIIRIKNGGGVLLWNKCFSQIHFGHNYALLDILISKIYLKYIPIHIHNFEHSGGITNIKLSSHGFLFHRNINRREIKAQIPWITHQNEKKQRIYFSCEAKDNWASQISEAALRKELEQWKIPFPPLEQYLRISNQQKMLRNCLEEDVCLYRPNARWEGEFEWLKTLQGPQLENCRKLLNLRVRKPLKK